MKLGILKLSNAKEIETNENELNRKQNKRKN